MRDVTTQAIWVFFIYPQVKLRDKPNPQPFLDEADNHIIELAVAANAKYIITNNLKDFANPELMQAGFEVISPQQLLGRIRS